ncbi:hypothetical protein HYALB_00013087 [Hymenoscyphus albidus]|uniref:Uncharacterized protein n=1 Tax=Hymenoscyphus albidus TaxID=595503 RepID=A0A9N9LYS4_9HELO|nr:hypothetical protein HYALB_00013087 [Hymenoscyphus albidus]
MQRGSADLAIASDQILLVHLIWKFPRATIKRSPGGVLLWLSTTDQSEHRIRPLNLDSRGPQLSIAMVNACLWFVKIIDVCQETLRKLITDEHQDSSNHKRSQLPCSHPRLL